MAISLITASARPATSLDRAVDQRLGATGGEIDPAAAPRGGRGHAAGRGSAAAIAVEEEEIAAHGEPSGPGVETPREQSTVFISGPPFHVPRHRRGVSQITPPMPSAGIRADGIFVHLLETGSDP